jgi:hypothetical protein
MNTQIKFGIRIGTQQRGKIVTGMTVVDYLNNVIGVSDFVLTPNGGWYRINNQTVDFGITIY